MNDKARMFFIIFLDKVNTEYFLIDLSIPGHTIKCIENDMK